MKERKKLLLLRPRKLGDTILATLVADALKRARPSWEIHYLVEFPYAELFQDHPSVDRVVKMPRGMGPWRTWEFATWLRKEDFDLALDLYSGLRTAFISRWCCPRSYGLRTRWAFLYTSSVPRRISPTSHHIENQFQLLNLLGIEEKPGPYRFPPPRPFPLEGPYAALHPFASPLKSMSEIQARELASHLLDMGLLPVFLGDKGEAEAIERLGIGLNMAGLDLPSTRNLIAGARVFVGIDSGLAHLASTTRTPMVVVFGPHLPENYRPWRNFGVRIVERPLPCRPCFEKKCPWPYPRCVQDIPAEQILGEVEALLNNPSSYPPD